MTNRRSIAGILRATAVTVLMSFTVVAGALAQDLTQERDSIPRISEAELLFEQGLSAFEQGDYDTAYERFQLVVDDYELHHKTTAAMLMGGKALVRMGQYEEAVELLETLLDRYPETTYQEPAESAIEVARQSIEDEGRQPDTLRLGIVLPMAGDDVSMSQALFNGIRLAVDEHNGVQQRYALPADLQSQADSFDVYSTAEVYGDSLAEAEGGTTVVTQTDTTQVDSLRVITEQTDRPEWVAKMFFRQFGGEVQGARAAVDSLTQQDEVDVILGPITSRSARPAGEVAEQSEVPLVAPLATDEGVSEGQEYVFQANPTIPLRGRIMARFASESLLMENVGIMYERGDAISGQWVDGFREEAEEEDIDIPFTLELDSPREWSRLSEAIEEDTTLTDSLLLAAEAIYLPMSGRNASGKIQDALAGLGHLGMDVRVLGNAEWHDLPVKKEASQFATTYTNDFYVQPERPEVQSFIRRYRMLTGETPSSLSTREQRLAYTGYDVAHFLLTTLSPSSFRSPPDELRSAPAYEGLGIRIHFQEGNVNEAMFFHRYRNDRLELLR